MRMTSGSPATASTRTTTTSVIGLMGPDLYPLSACVQAMRETRQASRYMDQISPFFVGKAIWQKASL